MKNNARKVILYISMSLDGYIADANGGLDFLALVAKEGEDYGYFDFVKTVDTIIIGRKTIDSVRAMGFDYPHTDKAVYIISRSEKTDASPFQYYSGDLKDLVGKLKSESGKNIYCDGGAEIVRLLQNDDLIDEYIISIIPTLLGDGTRLFKDGRPTQILELAENKAFDTGLVQLRYSRIR